MKNSIFGALTVALVLPLIGAAQTPSTAAEAVAGTPVIPRSALFGNPEKTQARISPDGSHVSFIAPRDGVLNVWVGPRSDPSAAKPVTNDVKRGIRQHFWAYDNKHVLYIQDEGGDENWHLYATDVVAGTTKDLTPYKGIQAQVAGLSWKKPGVVAVGLNDRVAEWHDLWEVNLATGKRVLIEQNSQEFAGYDLDLDLKPKLALKTLSEGGEIFRRAAGKWVSLLKFGQEDSLTTATLGIEGTGVTALMQSSVGRDKAALVRVNIATGKTTVLGASEQADVETVWTDPRMNTPQAYTVNYLKPEITVLAPAVKKDMDLLTKELGDGFSITNRSLDDNFWTVAADDALAPASSYLYDRKAGKITKLFDQRPALTKAPLVPCSRSRSRRATASRSCPIYRCRRVRMPMAMACPRLQSRWWSTCTAARGHVTATASTTNTSGSRIAAMPCSR
jgi:dipeptidyl aminopeptidase/acylaminoacyl peptidase